MTRDSVALRVKDAEDRAALAEREAHEWVLRMEEENLMTAARFYRCERMTSGRLGRDPTLGCIRFGLNMIHGPMGQNKVSYHRWQKRSLHQNDDCGRLRHDMDLGLMHMKVYSRSFLKSICTPESKSIRDPGGRHKLLLFWNPNVADANATLFPSCLSFLSNKTERIFPLSK
jgi:hypothetical protein